MAILIGLMAISVPAHAGDGDLQWRTIETRHFRITFPVGLERLGNRAAELCEEAHEIMGALMNYAPRERIEVSVTDFGDNANNLTQTKLLDRTEQVYNIVYYQICKNIQFYQPVTI